MRPVLPPFTQPATRSNAKIVWSAVALLGLLAALALWLVWSPSSLRAYSPALAGNAQSLPQELVPLDGIVQVAAGGGHTCALTTAGGVKCWGYNADGQLGDGTKVDRITPVDVIGLTSDIAAIAAGGSRTCALTTAGGVKCWGDNRYGQLGDNSTTVNKSNPVDVMGLGSGVVAIAAGNHHTCALTVEGGVKCWGLNYYGQLGNGAQGSWESNATPVDVVGLGSGVRAIDAGAHHTCALTIVGGVKCWGYNQYGQLGDGTTWTKGTPADVVGLGGGAESITAGANHTCTANTAGGVECWGRNQYGQLGDFTWTDHDTPVNVWWLGGDVQTIDAGDDHTCTVNTTGGVECWGHNQYGQLGYGATGNKNFAVDVVGLNSGAESITAGARHTCVLVVGGGSKCWGYNQYSQLGDGTTANKIAPADVLGSNDSMTAIAAGNYHTCALTVEGGVKCWGNNDDGQLGDSTWANANTPVDVTGLGSGVQTIVAGGSHTCALTTAGGVKCWGYNQYSQLGYYGTIGDRNSPGDVMGLTSDVAAITAGQEHTCALTTSGGVKCWGRNDNGQVGNGKAEWSSPAPVGVVGLGSGVQAIAAGSYHTCALTVVGGVKCWGNNYATTPVDVVGLSSGIQAISSSNCALTVEGGVKCWGTTVVDVVGLNSGVQAITAYWGHICALTTVGGVKCWGYNADGQLGDGTKVDRITPVDVIGLTSDIAAIAAGGRHTCAVTTGSGIKCWGSNSSGQLGDGTAWRTTPVDVVVEGEGSPTPTPTVTPTATTTPTITPTPTLPPSSGKPVVVLVDGWQGLGPRQIRCDEGITHYPDNQNFREPANQPLLKDMPDWLTQDGFEVWSAHLDTGPEHTASLADNATCLKNQLDQIRSRFPNDGAILIAHSMGGLVARAYMEKGALYQNDVKILFTLGTPHLGAPGGWLVWPNQYLHIKNLDCDNQPALCDFTLGIDGFNDEHPNRAKGVAYYLVSGDLPFFDSRGLGRIFAALIGGKDDGIVPTASGLGLSGSRQILQTNEAHIADFGENSYFVPPLRDLYSFAYSDCIQPVLKGNPDGCRSLNVAASGQTTEPALNALSPVTAGTLASSQKVTQTISLDGGGSALFAASWETGIVTFTLAKPDGQPIDSAYAAAHPTQVSYLPPEPDQIPLASYVITATEAGLWALTLQAGTVPVGSTDYSLFVAMETPITLTVQSDRSWYAAGAVAQMSAVLGGGVTASSVIAQIQRSDQVTDSLVLTGAGGGLYRGDYTVPAVPGYGTIQVTASGTDSNGHPFAREAAGGFQIASTAAALSGSYADRGEESAGDGQYEALAVDVGVTAHVSGTFAVAADLVSAANGAVIAKTATSASLITGTHTLTLRFDGEAIRAAQQDGPYRVTSVLLIDQRAAALPVQKAADVWTTAPYSWQEFGTPLQLYLPSITR